MVVPIYIFFVITTTAWGSNPPKGVRVARNPDWGHSAHHVQQG